MSPSNEDGPDVDDRIVVPTDPFSARLLQDFLNYMAEAKPGTTCGERVGHLPMFLEWLIDEKLNTDGQSDK